MAVVCLIWASAVGQAEEITPVEPVPATAYADVFQSDAEKRSAESADSNPQRAAQLKRGLDNQEPPDTLKQMFGDDAPDWQAIVDRLAAADFSTRERSTRQILDMGYQVVPLLRWQKRRSSDAEVRLRLSELLNRLEQEYESFLREAFLSGQQTSVPGWKIARQLMGDSLNVRRQFWAMRDQVPELVAALEGTTEQRAAALRDANAFFGFGTRERLAAILMAAADPDYVPDAAVETSVLGQLQRAQGSMLFLRPDSRAYANELTKAFVDKISDQNLSEWLFVGRDKDIESTVILAQQILNEEDQPKILAEAIQTLVKFGREEDIPAIAKLIDDPRAVAKNLLREGKLHEIRLADVALVAILILSDQPVTDVGYRSQVRMVKHGLDPTALATPVGDQAGEEIREKARSRVAKLLKAREIEIQADENTPVETESPVEP